MPKPEKMQKSPCLNLNWWLICLFLPLSLSLHAQDFDRYQLLKAEGELPDVLKTPTLEKLHITRDSMSMISGNRLEKKLQTSFFLETTLALDRLIRSGKVLFNDPVSTYVNQVADQVLAHDPKLRQSLQFFVVKSPYPNAFSTQKGIILIHLGLLARLESEAQLAYILAHEISHFTESHVLDLYVKSQQMDLNKGAYKHSKKDENNLLKSRYSKENEMAADLKGLGHMVKTEYQLDDLPELFDLFAEINRPFMPLFHYPNFWLNEYTLQEDLDELGYQELFEADSTAPSLYGFISRFEGTGSTTGDPESHPEPMARKKTIQAALDSIGPRPDRKLFLVSEEGFYLSRKRARYDQCQLLVQHKAFFDAIYHTLLLQMDDPDSRFLRKMLAKGLYGYSKYRLAEQRMPAIHKYQDIGYDQMLLDRELKLFHPDELTMMSLAYCWTLRKEDPTDRYIRKATEDLVYEFVLRYDLDSIHLFAPVFHRIWSKLETEAGFDLTVQKALDKKQELIQKQQRLKTKAGRKYVRKKQEKLEVHGYRMGIDKIVVFDPSYWRIHHHDGEPVDYAVDAERQQLVLNETIQKMADKLKLEVDFLDSRLIDSAANISLYQDIATIYGWHQERMEGEGVEMVASNYEEVYRLTQKYGTDYFVNLGVIATRGQPKFDMMNPLDMLVFVVVWMPPFTPIAAYQAFLRETGMIYGLVYNLKTEERIALQYNEVNMKVNEGLLRSNIYYYLYQIRKGKKS